MYSAGKPNTGHLVPPTGYGPPDAQVQRDATDLDRAVPPFLAYLSDYRRASALTVEAYGRDLKRLGNYLRSNELLLDVRAIDSRSLQAFAVSMSHLSPATIMRALGAVSSLFAYLIRSGVVTANPVDGVVKPKMRERVPRVPDVAESRHLVAACRNTRERAMLLLLLTGGLRRAELLGLRTGDLADDLRHVRVQGKGDQQRLVALPSQTQEGLRAYLDGRSDGSLLLFPSRRGTKLGNTAFQRMFQRILCLAGLGASGITPHCLRHHCATAMLQSGVDVMTVREVLGHRDLSSTCRYLHTFEATKRAAAEALPRYLPEVAEGVICGD